jgi:CheY-like chemotaxis protein
MSPGVNVCHVLVVDGEALMRWFLAQVAQDMGSLVTEVSNVERALALVRDSAMAVDLVSLGCPRRYADLAAVAGMKQVMPACHVGLMMPFSDETFAQRARASGVDSVLVKPIDIEDMRRLLHLVRSQRTIEHQPAACSLRDSECVGARAPTYAWPAGRGRLNGDRRQRGVFATSAELTADASAARCRAWRSWRCPARPHGPLDTCARRGVGDLRRTNAADARRVGAAEAGSLRSGKRPPPFPAFQPAGQHQQHHLERRGVDHEPELISLAGL